MLILVYSLPNKFTSSIMYRDVTFAALTVEKMNVNCVTINDNVNHVSYNNNYANP